MDAPSQTWVALFRGINVGGNHLIPMAILREILGELHLQNVRTYIQSGNVVFETAGRVSSSLGLEIAEKVQQRQGFSPSILLLSSAQWKAAVDENPFPEAIGEPKTLHFLFLSETPSNPNLEALHAKKSATERFVLTDSVFYFHAPDGIGRSKIAAVVERILGVVTTGRNYRTVQKLLDMTQ